jgi:hypothetical protein
MLAYFLYDNFALKYKTLQAIFTANFTILELSQQSDNGDSTYL